MEREQISQRHFYVSVISFTLILLMTLSSWGFGALDVNPADDYTVSGPEGGPFIPSQKIYTLTNVGEASLYWGVDESAGWIDCDPEWGSLDPNEYVEVAVSINALAELLPGGDYSEDVVFTDISNSLDYIRSVVLTVTADTSGPVAWWKLDGDFLDSSPNLHHGTFHDDNASGVQWVGGADGQAIDLDGVDDYVGNALYSESGQWAVQCVCVAQRR